MGKKKTECKGARKVSKGGKKSKRRVTIAFIVNGAGGSESLPIVIWHTKNPRCFNSVSRESFPAIYYNQAKSWMIGEILHGILGSMNRDLISKGRFVVLFMDNARCHPTDVVGKYRNIKIVFLPPNTTLNLQPLDLGIIQNFNLFYHKLLMSFVLVKIEERTTASDVVKSLTILHAIRRIAQAWNTVELNVKKKSFLERQEF